MALRKLRFMPTPRVFQSQVTTPKLRKNSGIKRSKIIAPAIMENTAPAM